jgi:5'-3' exoribonuclease 1
LLPGFFPPLYRFTWIMEPFNLPMLNGLHLIEGLCNGLHLIEGLCDSVFFSAPTLTGFPSLKTLPHTAVLGFHSVNVHGLESCNKSMIVRVDNPHEGHAEMLARCLQQ